MGSDFSEDFDKNLSECLLCPAGGMCTAWGHVSNFPAQKRFSHRVSRSSETPPGVTSKEQRFSHCPLCSRARAQCTNLKHFAQQRQSLHNNAYLVHVHWFFFSPTLILELCGTPGVLTVPPFYTGRAGRWAILEDAAGAALLLVWFVWRNHHTLHVLPITRHSSIQHRLFNAIKCNTRQCDISSNLLITLSSSNRVKVLNVWLSKQWDPVL